MRPHERASVSPGAPAQSRGEGLLELAESLADAARMALDAASARDLLADAAILTVEVRARVGALAWRVELLARAIEDRGVREEEP